MKVTDYVSYKIDRLPRGFVFTYEDFTSEVNKKEAVIKALNRMAASGHITKLAKGKYYKPEQTPFGQLKPSQKEIVKDLLEENGKIIGYLTGYSIYNELKLTTQVANMIQIGANSVRHTFKRDQYIISFIRQKNTITRDNIPLLQILDAIRNIRKIPGASIAFSYTRIQSIFKEFMDEEIHKTVRLSMKYPPSTRALLGSIIDDLGFDDEADGLLRTLNPITKYNFKELKGETGDPYKWNLL